ncbi:MAG: tail fiber domain-containing protein [Dysgonamonadaceae bacterium]|nr:tail fiber domain-containing protein [Dysgonamonadaceae bacterium]
MKRLLLFFSGLLITCAAFSQAPWSLTGNDILSSTDVLGTKDKVSLIFKVNGTVAGFTGSEKGTSEQLNSNASFGWGALNKTVDAYINGNLTNFGNSALGIRALQDNLGDNNTAVGANALRRNTTGSDNVAVGFAALSYNIVGNRNTAFGHSALERNTASFNTAVGYAAAKYNTSGTGITATGSEALTNNTTGSYNTANGYKALFENTIGANNTAVGAEALYNNRTGANNTAVGWKSLWNNIAAYNTALGALSLEKNTSGNYNVGLGYKSLNANTSGLNNTAAGVESLFSTTTGGQNVAIGYLALNKNRTGSRNTAVGVGALYAATVTDNADNTAIGAMALNKNTSGRSNTASGYMAMSNNTTGSYNTAYGYGALATNTTGTYNTAIGYNADVTKTNLTNATAIGYEAKVDFSNKVVIGNPYITAIVGQVNWTTLSDGRAKKNIQQNVPGLSFINALQPITYNLDLAALDKQSGIKDIETRSEFAEARKAKEQIVYSGFIAQDVEKAAESIQYSFSGVDNTDSNLYGLRYEEFVVPLAQAVQELSVLEEAEEIAIDLLQTQINGLREKMNAALSEEGYTISELDNRNGALQQNAPNPFNQSTLIQYTLPQTYSSAQIVIVDNGGRTIKHIPVSGSGRTNSISVEAGLFPAAGVYYYSLYVDGNLVDTKKMVKTNY